MRFCQIRKMHKEIAKGIKKHLKEKSHSSIWNLSWVREVKRWGKQEQVTNRKISKSRNWRC